MKRLVIIVLVVCGLIGGAIAAAPWIAATDLAKHRIASQIEEWTGQPVTFVGEPQVKLFPFLSLTIANAKIGGNAADGKPFVSMDRLTCKLRLAQFLIGRTEVAEFQLVRPVFRLTVDADGHASWASDHDSIASEASGAKEETTHTGATPRDIADIKLGRFKIYDGTIIYDDARNGRHEELTDVSVSLRWPEVGEAASGTGTFTWRNEAVEFNGSIAHPLNLIAGNASPARFGIASRPLRVSFSGTANSLADLQLEGEASVTAPSVRRVINWLGTPMGNGPILGAGLIEGAVNWIGSSLTLPNARIELDGNVAEGTASIDLSQAVPKIQGTLALDRLDLSAYLEALQARVRKDGSWQTTPVKLGLLDRANMDLRLSAGEILIGSARIGKSAAAVTIKDGKLSLGIGEAQFYGGQLEAEADVATGADGVSGKAEITLKDTPAAVALADLAGLTLVDGKTTARMAVSGHGDTWGGLLASLEGTVGLGITDGALLGFDLGQLAELSGGYGIADPAPGSGKVPIKSLTGTLHVAGGTVTSDDIVATGDTFTITASGALSLINQNVRGHGVLEAEPAGDETAKRRNIPFVVSGSWFTPLLLPDYERLIQRGAERQTTKPPVDSAARAAAPKS